MVEEMNKNQEVRVGMGVFVLVFNSDYSKLLMVKRNKAKLLKWGVQWGNLGGSLELREYSVDGAMREAWEEAGLKLERKNMKLLEVRELPNFSEKHHGISFVYATSIAESTKIKLNDESEEFKWFKIDSLPDSMFDKKEDIINWKELALK